MHKTISQNEEETIQSKFLFFKIISFLFSIQFKINFCRFYFQIIFFPSDILWDGYLSRSALTIDISLKRYLSKVWLCSIHWSHKSSTTCTYPNWLTLAYMNAVNWLAATTSISSQTTANSVSYLLNDVDYNDVISYTRRLILEIETEASQRYRYWNVQDMNIPIYGVTAIQIHFDAVYTNTQFTRGIRFSIESLWQMAMRYIL